MMNTEKYYSFQDSKPHIFTHLRQIDDTHSIAQLVPEKQKSFYGKAVILFTPFSCALFSYGTPIISRYIEDTQNVFFYHRLYDRGYEIERPYFGGVCVEWKDTISPTTLRHIRAFCGMSKKEFIQNPVHYEEASEWREIYAKLMKKRGKK